MKLFALPSLILLTGWAHAHGGLHEAAGHVNEQRFLNTELSLPKLLAQKPGESLPHWVLTGSATFLEGRLLLNNPKALGSDKAGIWSVKPLDKDAWTIELTFRSLSSASALTSPTDGFSLWLVSDQVKNDEALSGGPSRFDGLRLAINHVSPETQQGLTAFLGDGGSSPAPFHRCQFAYQDQGNTPFTVRVSYSGAEHNWFKIQINNKLCVATTSQVKLPKGLHLGLSASQGLFKENFEVLKMEVFDAVTEAARDDHGVADAKLDGTRVVQTVVKETVVVKEPLEPQAPRAKTPVPPQEAKRTNPTAASEPQVAEILNQLGNIRAALSVKSGGETSEVLQQLVKSVLLVRQEVSQMANLFQSSQQAAQAELAKLTKAVALHQGEFSKLHLKLASLLDSHSVLTESISTPPADALSGTPDTLAYVVRILKWLALSIVILFVVLGGMIWRLKKDIGHNKLL